jgi:hypothetical protein
VPRELDAGIRPTSSAPLDASASLVTALTTAPEIPGGQLLIDDVPTPKAWDYYARIGYATKLAHGVLPDARLVHITGSGVLANGTLDLTAVSYVSYTFRSPSLSDRGTRPRGSLWTCLVSVTARGNYIQVVTGDSECNEPFFTPRCDGRELWAIAAARGAETDRRADLYLYPDAGHFVWKLRPDESYDIDDAECAR